MRKTKRVEDKEAEGGGRKRVGERIIEIERERDVQITNRGRKR